MRAPATVIQTNNGNADLDSEIKHFTDLASGYFTKRPAHNSEVQGIHTDTTTVDLAKTGHQTIPRDAFFIHVKSGVAVGHHTADLLERTFIEKCGNPFTSCLFTLGVLCLNPSFAAAKRSFFTLLFYLIDEYFMGSFFIFHSLPILPDIMMNMYERLC